MTLRHPRNCYSFSFLVSASDVTAYGWSTVGPVLACLRILPRVGPFVPDGPWSWSWSCILGSTWTCTRDIVLHIDNNAIRYISIEHISYTSHLHDELDTSFQRKIDVPSRLHCSARWSCYFKYTSVTHESKTALQHDTSIIHPFIYLVYSPPPTPPTAPPSATPSTATSAAPNSSASHTSQTSPPQ